MYMSFETAIIPSVIGSIAFVLGYLLHMTRCKKCSCCRGAVEIERSTGVSTMGIQIANTPK